jgi:C4-dicarboxylate transporter DctM subunit
MSPLTVGILCIIAFLILMFFNMPVPFSMLFVSFAGLCILRSPAAAFQGISSDLFAGFSSYTLSVAPVFGLMGFLASYSGIGESLFKTVDMFIGHIKGGIACAVQVASAGFGAICGSTPATMGTMTAVAYPEMQKRGYNPKLSVCSIGIGSTLSILIPPSSTMILYGSCAEESVGRLFMAGLIPGIVLCIINCVIILMLVKRHPDYVESSSPKATWPQRLKSLRRGGIIEIGVLFILVMGGMFGGFFTPTEAASIGAVGVLIIGLLQRKISFKKLKISLAASAKLCAMVYFIITCGTFYGRLIALSTIPSRVAGFVTSLTVAPWLVVAVIILIYFILGMFIDGITMIVLTVPIFKPVFATLGYDGIWFGVIIVLVLILGGQTPPVGINCFYMKGFVKDVSLTTIFSGVWPFVGGVLVAIALVIIFPPLATWLPTTLFGA